MLNSSFVGAHYLSTLVPLLQLICLAHLWKGFRLGAKNTLSLRSLEDFLEENFGDAFLDSFFRKTWGL